MHRRASRIDIEDGAVQLRDHDADRHPLDRLLEHLQEALGTTPLGLLEDALAVDAHQLFGLARQLLARGFEGDGPLPGKAQPGGHLDEERDDQSEVGDQHQKVGDRIVTLADPGGRESALDLRQDHGQARRDQDLDQQRRPLSIHRRQQPKPGQEEEHQRRYIPWAGQHRTVDDHRLWRGSDRHDRRGHARRARTDRQADEGPLRGVDQDVSRRDHEDRSEQGSRRGPQEERYACRIGAVRARAEQATTVATESAHAAAPKASKIRSAPCSRCRWSEPM